MHNITLIGTIHKERGFCTSNELYKIFEAINPDVIFEEIPPSYFDKYYVTKTRRNLESDTVVKYLGSHNIQHIPVDSDDVPPDSFFEDLEYLYKRIESITDINGSKYRYYTDENSLSIKINGFQYINSNDCIAIQNEIEDSIKNSLIKINDEKLSQIHQEWIKVNENRENKMLQNIYNYSKQHTFNKAIFMIGFAHRKSIIQKIAKYENTSEIKLNWSFFNI